MKVYEGANIRNVAVVGHGHAGKTSLVSAMLYTSGATPRLGRVDDGSATTDWDDEEIARKMSISAGLAYVEWGKTKINIVDTPGFNMFVHEAKMVLPVVDAAVVVVDGVAGVEVVTQRVWNYCEEFKTPRLIVASRMDRDRADAERVLESLTNAFGRAVIPLELPIGKEKNFNGVVDLVQMKAYTYELGGNGKGKETEIPANLKDQAQEAHEKLVELIAEGDDKLMEEFFEKGTIPVEDLIPALHNAIREDKIFPVIFGSGLGNVGADRVMDFIVDYTPAPSEHEWVQGEPAASGNGEPPKRHETDTEPVSLYVFKTISDAFAGRISYFKVFSGVLKNDATVQNFSRGSQEKLAHISIMQGKTAVPVTELHAGDIGAVSKLKDTLTGDTLGDKSAPIQYPKVHLPEPAITFAIEPKSRADEDKLGPGIHKLMEEDAMLRFFRDPQTKEFLIAGTGQQHIEVVVSKMKKRYHTEVILKAPKVPYRETIRGKADVQGRHKKQTGGHGQYGDCKIKMEPLPRGGEFEFVNDIFGGAIPKNYIPAIEKGIRDAAVARISGGISRGGFPSDPLRRLVSRRRFERHVLPDGGPHRLQESHGAGQAHAARTGHGSRDHGSGRVRRQHHGRPEQPPRPHPGHGQQRRQHGRESRSPHVRNADLRRRSHFDDPGPRQLQHGNASLRRRARPAAGKDHREGEGRARGCEGRGRVEH